jgi:transcriptional regulator with XRE-family HTH domain
MNERFLLLRKELGLTQEKMGLSLGVRKTAISKIEKGENNLTDQMLKLTCMEFSVSEEWLRTGKGEMFREDDFVYDLGMYAASATDFEKEFITGFMKLSDSTKDEIMKMMMKMADKFKDNN